jgi:hypothetical protein
MNYKEIYTLMDIADLRMKQSGQVARLQLSCKSYFSCYFNFEL